MLTMFLAALDQTIVATALPTIGRQFHDVSNLSWVITAYLLASTAVAPVFGTLSDIYGRRAMIIAALSLFIAGSVLCALAPNMPVLILARGLQGLGGGGIMPVVQTVISDVVTPRERGQYQAYFSGVWVAAGIGGPVLGGVFAEHLHWSMIFWINVPLGARRAGAAAAEDGQDPGVPPPAQGRLARRRVADGVRRRLHAGADLGRQPLSLAVADDHGDDRRARSRWRSPSSGTRASAEEPFLPLPLMGGTVVPYAMAAGGCALGAMIGLTVHLPLYYRGGLSPQRQRSRACADSARGDLDLRCGDRRPHHGARQALQAGRDHRNVDCRGLAAARWRSRRCRCGDCWCCCRCSRSASARPFRSAWSRCRTRWRVRRSAP